MLAVRGIFENGVATPIEPVDEKKGPVVIVFLEEDKKRKSDKDVWLSFAGIWENKSEDEVKVYEEIIKDRKNFGRGDIIL